MHSNLKHVYECLVDLFVWVQVQSVLWTPEKALGPVSRIQTCGQWRTSCTSSESWTLSWALMQSFSANTYVSSSVTAVFVRHYALNVLTFWLCCHWPISGDWREGSTFTEEWRDDEVHGTEAWSCPQTYLPHRQAKTGSLSMSSWPLSPSVLHQAHSVVETSSPLKLYWSITVIAVVISKRVSLCYPFVFRCSRLFWCPLHVVRSPLVLMIGSVNQCTFFFSTFYMSFLCQVLSYAGSELHGQ